MSFRLLLGGLGLGLLLDLLPATALSGPGDCFGQAPTRSGSASSETINGTAGRDVIVSLRGDDVIFGKGGDDLICAGDGNDQIHGGGGDDSVLGGAGNDQAFGQGGDDTLLGGLGGDLLGGGANEDSCHGDNGADRGFCETEAGIEDAAGAPGGLAPTVGDCPVLPANNPWNRDISRAPRHTNSADYIRSINESGGNGFLHADFGENQDYGIPFVEVRSTQSKVPIRFNAYGDQSDKGPYPIPLNAPVEDGSDRHVIAFQKGTCVLHELFAASRSGAGWVAASGAVFNMHSNALRPEGWTSGRRRRAADLSWPGAL